MLTAEQVRQLLDYDPATGVFTWLTKPGFERYTRAWNKRFAGKRAGRSTPNKNGYLEIAIDGKLYYSHRLAWLYMTGEWPEENTDHINGDKIDNRFENLREATVPENSWNMHNRKANQHGLAGVNFHPNCINRPYSSQLQIRGKKICLGYFATPEEAHQAYVDAARLHHGEFANVA